MERRGMTAHELAQWRRMGEVAEVLAAVALALGVALRVAGTSFLAVSPMIFAAIVVSAVAASCRWTGRPRATRRKRRRGKKAAADMAAAAVPAQQNGAPIPAAAPQPEAHEEAGHRPPTPELQRPAAA